MTKIKRSKNKYFSRIFNTLFTSTHFPLVLTATTLGLLFVVFRMKSVEQDYNLHRLNKKIEEANHENTELSAKKARLLSAQNLRLMAEKHNLNEPKQEQIIVIP